MIVVDVYYIDDTLVKKGASFLLLPRINEMIDIGGTPYKVIQVLHFEKTGKIDLFVKEDKQFYE